MRTPFRMTLSMSAISSLHRVVCRLPPRFLHRPLHASCSPPRISLPSVAMSVEEAKKKAGYAAVDEFVQTNQVVGIGSGSTVVYVIERLAARVQAEGLKVVCVPTSFQSRGLLLKHGLTVGTLDDYPAIDVTIDGADEVDANLALIKGGGACQTQEKVVAANSKTLVIVADYRKDSARLGDQWKKGVPVEVMPFAHVPVMHRLRALGGNPVLRMGTAETKAGPVVTDNGNFVLDVTFPSIDDPAELDRRITLIPGVTETGLFANMAAKAFFGQADGSVTTRIAKTSKA